ncbi:alpha/beta hydrolase [Flavisolibacter sp. BT320]|nr:alpha/beta hydrolase [Flavisolibacter longurius]
MRKTLAAILFFFSSFTALGQKAKQQETSKPFILGEIHHLESKVLGESRMLNVYLPEGYKSADTTKYPVIYLLDGSADEDFIHIVGLVQYNSFEWVNQLPKSIVVGIATVDRRRDFTFPTSIEADRKRYPTAGHSGKFISFLASELQPFIERKFRTNLSKTIIGQSLGGLLATEIAVKHPTLFNQYIIVSPSLWWDNGSLLNKDAAIYHATFTQNTTIYIGVGKEGLTPTAIPRVMEVDANVLADKLKATKSNAVNVLFDYLPQENHATILHQAVANAFRQIAAEKSGGTTTNH